VVSAGLCGGSRPGHFDGVSTVVTKLFNQVLPDNAYFGEKDYQQVAVIRKMVSDLCMPINVVTVPTARAGDGLALSSRNGYLSADERALAIGLYKTLNEIAAELHQGLDLESVLSGAVSRLNSRGFKTDYIEVRNANDLSPVTPATMPTTTSITTGTTEIVILAAAFLGNARLIDNMVVTLNQGIV
jgi:pantoate--beta-alanine ligase